MPLSDDLVIENAQIMFRNFAGVERQFNSEGDRNFCVFLDAGLADKLRKQGWNIKQLRSREEDEPPQDYMKVSVNYKKGRPPRIVVVSSRGRTDWGMDEIEMLDYADLKQVDLVINPYNWEVGENTGIKAYLKNGFFTLNENELDLKYADVPDANPTKKSDSTVSEAV